MSGSGGEGGGVLSELRANKSLMIIRLMGVTRGRDAMWGKIRGIKGR